MIKIWCKLIFFFAICGVAGGCLSDSEAFGQSKSLLDDDVVKKIVRDTVFLSSGKKVHIPGITSGLSKVLILTRHAEKDTMGLDPGLSLKGEESATRLASLMQATPLEQIYVTHFRRVFLTVKPVATLKRVGLKRYEPGDQISLIKELGEKDNGVYLVCGHSNTIPQIIGELTGENETIGEEDYDQLWIIELSANNRIRKFRF